MATAPNMVTAMTTLPGVTEPGIGRRAVATALTAIVLLLVAGYAAAASVAIQKVAQRRNVALLVMARSEQARSLDGLSVAAIRNAVAASPLEQRTINVAMARETRAQGNGRLNAWLALIARLGWRDTQSSQNLLYAAAMAQDLPRIVDVSDALLRRQRLTDQIFPMLTLMESDPRLQAMLAARLAGRPSWRGFYFSSTGSLRTREQLVSRFALIRQLQNAGVRLDLGEVVPSIIALDRGNLPAYGFDLWSRIQPGVTRPLDDTDFSAASRSYDSNYDPVPYQWRMMSGEGFSADATRDGGRARLSIDWDGRGVPVFAQQRTSAMPGRFALTVDVPREDAGDLSALAFRLTCPGGAVPFQPAGAGRYVTPDAVPCAYPVLEIAGDVQPSATAHQLVINRIMLAPLTQESR